jgi:hypothetical protein
MKYNYIISIFLLILVVIISQCIYVYNNKKIVEGWFWSKKKKKTNTAATVNRPAVNRAAVNRSIFRSFRSMFRSRRLDIRRAMRRAAEQARLAAEAARAKYLAFVGQFVNDRQTPYVNLLGQAYVNSVNPSGQVGVPYLDNYETQTNLKAYQEAIQIEALANQTKACSTDADIAKIFDLTSQILSGGGQNSTKVYFISEVILKGLGHFYVYNIKNNETQFNYLNVQFPKTFKDDNDIKKKYYKFISLLALSHISKSTTSSSLPPSSNYFLSISAPIISECKIVINELNTIKYDLSTEEKAEIQNKYKTIVK